MYQKIMVPVDLDHLGQLEKALTTAADLAKYYKIPVWYVGVTASTPTALAHNPQEYAEKLATFARDQGQQRGHDASAHAVTSHDPRSDLENSLLSAAHELSADLVVMASHAPNLGDTVWPSHGGKLATHSDATVMLVR